MTKKEMHSFSHEAVLDVDLKRKNKQKRSNISLEHFERN